MDNGFGHEGWWDRMGKENVCWNTCHAQLRQRRYGDGKGSIGTMHSVVGEIGRGEGGTEGGAG